MVLEEMSMKKYINKIGIIILVIFYIIMDQVIKILNAEGFINTNIFIYFIIPMMGLIVGFIFTYLNERNQNLYIKIDAINLVLVLIVMGIYYLPFLGIFPMELSYYLLISNVRIYILPLIGGCFLFCSILQTYKK